MQISKETIAIFKNFANINSNLMIKPGSKLVTMATHKNIIAEAVVAEDFPQEFGIYDLNEFLGALSLFESPDLKFNDKSVTIKEGRHSVRYYAASPSVMTPVPAMKELPTPDIEFDLPAAMISQIQKVSSILRVPDFSIIGDGQGVRVSVGDKSNPTGNSFESELGETDKTFQVNFKVDNLKLIPGDYAVAIAAKKISRFQSKSQQLKYFIAIERDSTFGF